MIRHLFSVALLCVAGGLASVAQAGVTGNSYTGLLTLANNDTGLSSASFGTESWIFSRQFLGDLKPVLEAGRFSETDLFVISLWEGTLATPGSRQVRPVNGISIFGIVTTVAFPGPNETPLATGVYISDDISVPDPGPFLTRFTGGDGSPFSAGCLASARDTVLRSRLQR